MWRSWWEDLRYGFRALRLSRGFAPIASLTPGIGIAANTTVFAWIHSILVSPIPGARDNASLYLLETVTPTGEVLGNFSYIDYRDYCDHIPALDGLAVARFTNLTYGTAGSAERVWGELVSPNYFETLGVQPALGNLFRAMQVSEAPEAAPYVVVSHAFSATRLRSDPSAIGKTIKGNLRDLTVAGVAAPGLAPGLNFSFIIRAAGDSATALSQFRQQSLRADLNAQVYQTGSLSDAIASATCSHQVAAWLLSAIGAAASLLAPLGISSAILFGVGLLATLVPASWASRVHPAAALRAES